MKKFFLLSLVCTFLFTFTSCSFFHYSENLQEFKQDSDGCIYIDAIKYIPVNIQDLNAVRCESKPFGYADNHDNKVYKVTGVDNDEWIFTHQFGLMMGWEVLYRAEGTREFDFSTFNAEEIRLSVGDIPNPLRNSKIVETITDVDTVKNVCDIIRQGEFVAFGDMSLSYLRSVSILSSEHKGLAFIYTLQQDEQNNIYISSMMENGGYKINEIFGYVSR